MGHPDELPVEMLRTVPRDAFEWCHEQWPHCISYGFCLAGVEPLVLVEFWPFSFGGAGRWSYKVGPMMTQHVDTLEEALEGLFATYEAAP